MYEIFTTELCSLCRGITILGTGGRCSLETAFTRMPGYGFGRDFCITCIRNCTF